ncbi:hypothetical protein ACQ1ZK_16330, partial [Enterococcus faecium]
MAIGVLLWQQRTVVASSLAAIPPLSVAVSLLLGIVGAALAGLVWGGLLIDQGHPTRALEGLRAFFLAQLGK